MYEPTEEPRTLKAKMKSFIIQCVRVLKITKKPNAEEYKMLVKVSGLGITVIGMLGFLLHMIKVLVLPF